MKSNFIVYLQLWKMCDVVWSMFQLRDDCFIFIFLASVTNFEDQTSVSASEGLLSYSHREWKGNTAKSHLIRKVQILDTSSNMLKCLISEGMLLLIDILICVCLWASS